jgi:hypothetical protein
MNVHSAVVRIVREEGFVSAMGHRVALHLGGEPELRRRVLAQLAQLDSPPETIRFERIEPALPPVDELLAQPEPEAAPEPQEPPAEPETEPRRAAARPPPRRQKGKS